MVVFFFKFRSDPEGQIERQISTVLFYTFYMFFEGSFVKRKELQYSNHLLPFFRFFRLDEQAGGNQPHFFVCTSGDLVLSIEPPARGFR